MLTITQPDHTVSQPDHTVSQTDKEYLPLWTYCTQIITWKNEKKIYIYDSHISQADAAWIQVRLI